jgi:hypothetical protein
MTRDSLEEAVKSGDRRVALYAIRDYLAHELEGNRCRTCAMSQLRTGDTAALVLRLTKVLEEIEALPPEGQEETGLDRIRGKAKLAAVTDLPLKGTKNAPRQQGGRAPRGTRKESSS